MLDGTGSTTDTAAPQAAVNASQSSNAVARDLSRVLPRRGEIMAKANEGQFNIPELLNSDPINSHEPPASGSSSSGSVPSNVNSADTSQENKKRRYDQLTPPPSGGAMEIASPVKRLRDPIPGIEEVEERAEDQEQEMAGEPLPSGKKRANTRARSKPMEVDAPRRSGRNRSGTAK